MSKKLSWEQINTFYFGQWVELVDFNWDWNQAVPRHARVKASSIDRNELMAQIRERDNNLESVVLFVGGAKSIVGPKTEIQHQSVTI